MWSPIDRLELNHIPRFLPTDFSTISNSPLDCKGNWAKTRAMRSTIPKAKLKDSAIQTRFYENWVSRYFVTSLNFTPSLSLFTVLFAYVAFLGIVSWLWVCVEVAIDRISQIQPLSNPSLSPPPPAPTPPNVQGVSLSLPRILCLTSNSYLKSGRA